MSFVVAFLLASHDMHYALYVPIDVFSYGPDDTWMQSSGQHTTTDPMGKETSNGCRWTIS